MPTFGNGGFQFEIPDVDFNAAAAVAVGEVAPSIVTPLAQQLLASAVPPSWWGGGFAGGLNYKMAVLSAPVAVTSTSFVNVLSTTFTPQSPTSKVLAIGKYNIGQSAANITHVSLFRGETNLAPPGLTILDWIREPIVDLPDVITPHGFMTIDAPETAAEVTYTIRAYVSQNTSYFGRRHDTNGGTDVMPPGASLFLLELPGGG